MIKKDIEIDGEIIHLKKDKTGWRIIYPLTNSNGLINWKNLIFGGSYWNFIKLLIILGILFFIMWSYKQDMANCFEYASKILECSNEIYTP